MESSLPYCRTPTCFKFQAVVKQTHPFVHDPRVVLGNIIIAVVFGFHSCTVLTSINCLRIPYCSKKHETNSLVQDQYAKNEKISNRPTQIFDVGQQIT